MPTVTDCKRWLDSLKPASDDTVYSLYNTVLDEQGCGLFQCSNRGKEFYIRSSNSEEWLMIPSERARKDFLAVIRAKYFAGEDVQSWYARKAGSMSKTG